jgi:hypothetical protein
MKYRPCIIVVLASLSLAADSWAQTDAAQPAKALSYCIVDTGQRHCFSDRGQLLEAPRAGDPFFGQDGLFAGHQASYTLSADGLTVQDTVTGLTWQRSPDTNRDGSITYADKSTWAEAQAVPAALNAVRYGGYNDWRLPTVRQLYSLINFSGSGPRPHASSSAGATPYIDTTYFGFAYGFTGHGERIIDSQWASTTLYAGNSDQMFGVNFADGRIKGYPASDWIGKKYFVLCVRGNPSYGVNHFADNGDGTVNDHATGLMWSQADSGKGLNWQDALAWCENLTLAGHDDWRLPNAKELQSLVDYTRAPDARDPARRGPAIDPIFTTTDDEAWFWSSTTHLEGPGGQGAAAVYVAFGRATGFMPGPGGWRQPMNVHGAGAQRSDPKSGDPQSPQWAGGLGPQGDEIRIYNYARAVRNIDPSSVRQVQPDLTPLPAPPPFPGGPAGFPPWRPGRKPPPKLGFPPPGFDPGQGR